jgi:hypothetical protein
MTLDELDKLKQAAAKRDHLLKCIEEIRTAGLYDGRDHPYRGEANKQAFGFELLPGHVEAMRQGLIGDLQRQVSDIEGQMRAGGVVFPGDPLPVLEPVVSMRGAPTPREVEVGHPLIVPRSWDQQEGTFTVAVPCDPATSVRWLDGGLVQVDEALNPHGLSDGPIGTPVIDRTEGVEAQVGTVRGWGFRHDGIELHVRLERPWDKVRAAIEARRLHLVGIGYEIRNEEIVSRPGQRPLADVLRWSLKEIRLHRTVAKAEAA